MQNFSIADIGFEHGGGVINSFSPYGPVTLQSPAALGDIRAIQFASDAGYYDIVTHYTADINKAIVTWYLDDVLIGTVDHYAAATVNGAEFIMHDVAISAGEHTLKAKVESKNAASTGYFAVHGWLYLQPR